jgi:hypothetical protein
LYAYHDDHMGSLQLSIGSKYKRSYIVTRYSKNQTNQT